MVCDQCGRAVDVDHPIPAALVDEISLASGFAITGYDLQIRGVCPSCRPPTSRVAEHLNDRSRI